MEIGIYTFAETSFDPTTGRQLDVGRRLQDLLEEIELADEVGLDVFGVGEHHRPDYAVSTPAVILAAAAARTKRIRLTSAVSVLSSDDPLTVGPMPHPEVMRAIELLGTEVAPVVRREVGAAAGYSP